MYDFMGEVGNIAIKLGFVASVFAMVMYFRSLGKVQSLGTARLGFHVAVTTVLLSSALLLILIVKHQFQFHYIWAYSSRELPLGLLMSTFYAGQEGSFLLWTLMVAIVGIILMLYTQRHDNEREVMGVYSAVLSFLMLLLIVKNPFTPIDAPVIPADGRGLNPLLQNFWMQIHPPILFVGFAAMTPPFALAIAAMMRRRYQDWVVSSLPWVVGGAMVLGLGIALGGFWAYETLGWGGWWGWDPVENASLIPWLVSVGLVHTMVTQKRTKGLIMTNFLLAILAFVLVLYSTFLTRSGVLGDASVHSFVDPGRFSFTLLVLFMFAFTDVGFALLFGRFTRFGSRLFDRFTGWKLLAVTYLVVIGPSIPIFAQVSGDVTPVFSEMIAGGGVLVVLYYPLLWIAHLMNLLAVLWLPALILKLAMIGYVFTGRLHSEKEFESFHMLSRETWIGLGAAAVGLLAFIVLVGTSMPIIPQFIVDAINGVLGWWNGIAGSDFHLGNTVEPAFYDAMGLPIAIIMVAMTGFSLLLMWKSTPVSSILSKLWLPLLLAALSTIATVVFGEVYHAGMILLALTSFFSLYSNLTVGVRIMRGNPRFSGAYVAHIGIAMMLLAVIGSGFYSTSTSVELKENETVEALGYRFTYVGVEPFWNGERYYFKVRIDDLDGNELETVNTIMFVSNYGNQEQIFRNPGISNFISRDIYVEPQALYRPDPEGGKRFKFRKGDSHDFGGYQITFVDFDMNNSRESESFRLGGVFRVGKYGEGAQELTAIRTTGPEGVRSDPAIVAEGDLAIDILEMTPNPDDLGMSVVEVRMKNPNIPVDPNDKRETLVVEASIKPYISFVWLGIILMTLGFLIARSRRARDAKRLEAYEISEEVRTAPLRTAAPPLPEEENKPSELEV